MPIAATTQMVAALVSPTTAPRAWRIVPAPMKPTPGTIWAATRVVSVPGEIDPPPADSIASDRWVYSTEPTQIRMLVRSPAGLPPISRSRPIAPPSSVARPSCSIKSSRKISTMRPRTSATQESHAIADLGDRAARELTGLRRAAPQALQHARRLGAQQRRETELQHQVEPEDLDHATEDFSHAGIPCDRGPRRSCGARAHGLSP